MMDRIGEFLSLQGEGAAVRHGFAEKVDGLAVSEEIAAVELQAGLVGIDLQHPAGHGADHPGIQAEAARAGIEVDNPVVVIAVAVSELLVVGFYKLSDGARLAEIQRTAVDDYGVPERYQLVIHSRHAAGRNLHNVIQNVALAAALEVEERVVRKVDGRGGVGSGFELHLEVVLLSQGVAHADGLVAGESAQAVGMQHLKLQAAGALLHDIPHQPVDADEAAVQRILAVVLIQFIFHPVKGEARSGDTVGHRPHAGAEEALPFPAYISVDIRPANHHVPQAAVPVRSPQRHHTRAVIGNLGSKAAAPDSINRHILAVDFGLEGIFGNKFDALVSTAGCEKKGKQGKEKLSHNIFLCLKISQMLTIRIIIRPAMAIQAHHFPAKGRVTFIP